MKLEAYGETIVCREAKTQTGNFVMTENNKAEVISVGDKVDNLKEEIVNLPEPKQYDEEISFIEDRINIIKQEMVNLPEPKYYEEDIQSIKEDLQKVRETIPTLPDWVTEDSLPDLTWVGRTFSTLDENVTKVDDALHTIKARLKTDVEQILETIDTRDFEKRVQIDEVKTTARENRRELEVNLDKVVGIYLLPILPSSKLPSTWPKI